MFCNKLKHHFAPIAGAAASFLSATVLRRALSVGLGLAALLGVSGTGATTVASECRPAWSETPTPPGSNSFYAVVALARDDVWGVGSRYDGVDDRPLAEHFDGGRWVTVTVPAPASAAYLRGVGGSSGTDVWAAGYQTTNSGTVKTFIEHYDGTAWSIVPSPNPVSVASYLSTVAAVATNDVWAAGHYLDGAFYRTLVEHWDGTSWTIVPTPNPGDGDNALNGIAVRGPNDVWAVGYQLNVSGTVTSTLVLHFDGTNWNVVLSPNPGQPSSLAAVVASPDGQIWAAGFYYDGTQGRTLLLHGDDSGFVAVPGEDFPGEGNVLLGIAAAGPGDMWVAGYHYPSGTSDFQGLIEHYDGEQWSRVSSAQGGTYTYLAGITAWPPGAGWAVGNTLTTTIAESVCEIQVNDVGFIPRTAGAILGDTVGWSVTGSVAQRLVDASGMTLFDSQSRAPGSSFQFSFNSAGTYPVSDTANGATSTIAIPVQAPASGNVGTPFLVTWSAASPADGFLFDVQIRRPGDRRFRSWRVGQTDTAASFVPTVAGNYAFRARLRNSVNGTFSNWSPPAVVIVGNP